jgi:hypothetical protein
MPPNDDVLESRGFFKDIDGFGRLLFFICDLDVFVYGSVCRTILRLGRLREISVGRFGDYAYNYIRAGNGSWLCCLLPRYPAGNVMTFPRNLRPRK